jgi:hypothetical protein
MAVMEIIKRSKLVMLRLCGSTIRNGEADAGPMAERSWFPRLQAAAHDGMPFCCTEMAFRPPKRCYPLD